MENQEKDIHADNNDSNIQPSAAKSAEEIMNEIENRATENSATEPNKSFEELEEKAEGLLEKIGFGKNQLTKKKRRN